MVRVGHLRYLTTAPTVQTLSGEYSSTFDDHVHTFYFPGPIAEMALLNELVVNVGGRVYTVDNLYAIHHPRNFLPAHLEASSNEWDGTSGRPVVGPAYFAGREVVFSLALDRVGAVAMGFHGPAEAPASCDANV